jgi:hypothetical protein
MTLSWPTEANVSNVAREQEKSCSPLNNMFPWNVDQLKNCQEWDQNKSLYQGCSKAVVGEAVASGARFQGAQKE